MCPFSLFLCRTCFALLTVLTLVGTVQARSLVDIRATNQLRVCVAGSSATFYRENGEAFARRLGVEPVVVTLKSWDEQFFNREGRLERDQRYVAWLLENGQCDLFPNDLHMLDWRLSKMDIVPYYTVRKMVVAHQRLRLTVKVPADLAGHHAAVQKGTSYDNWLTQQNETTYRAKPVLVEYFSTAESVQRVSRGLVDFTVTGSEGAFKWIRSGEYDNLDLLFPVDDIVSVGWGLSPSAPDLREALQSYFEDSLRVGSDLDRSWQQYYGISRTEYRFFEQSLDTQAAERAALRAWAFPVGTGIAGLLVAMFFWTWRLRREARSHRQTADSLAHSRHALERESSRRLVVSQIQMALHQASTQEELAQTLLSELATHLGFQQGLFCAVDGTRLHALARYAGEGDTADAQLHRATELGPLLDEAVRTRSARLLSQQDGAGLRIQTSSGEYRPATVLIQPLVFRDEVVAVIELASMGELAADCTDLLEDLMPFVVVSVDRLRR